MIPLIVEKTEEINRLCVKYRVKSLEVFGTAASDEFNPESSDIDFLVEFLPLEPKEHADSYFSLIEDLEIVLKKQIDLVEVKAINNPYLLESINHAREVVYRAA